jgi:major membrane immunogen (membrane-anchored lipoprotein)
MKQHYILFVLMSVLLFACGKKQEEKLCKKWIVYKVDFENIDKDTVGQDPLQTGMEDVFKELMSNMLSNTEYTFNEDGSYDVLYGTNKNKGTWKLEDSGKHPHHDQTG